MVSLIIASRVKDNPDSKIHNLLESLEYCGGNTNNCEVLIKYDTDDDLKPNPIEFNKYPFKVKIFNWDRYDARYSLHIDYAYLFTEIDPKSKYILNIADDYVFLKDKIGILDEILAIQKEHSIICNKFPRLLLDTCDIKNYRVNTQWRNCAEILFVSTNTMKIIANFGWQSNTDNWITLLHVILYTKYNLDLTHKIEYFYERTPQIVMNRLDGFSALSPDLEGTNYGNHRGSPFNRYNKMYVDVDNSPYNQYYYDLVEQQAKNIYLNILVSGNINDYLIKNLLN